MKIRFVQNIKRYFFIDGKSTRLLCFFIALALVSLTFGDVIFNKASISMVDLYNFTSEARTTGTYHPERPGYTVVNSFADPGGGAFQSEPMIQLMKFNLQTKQSPYWNPYSATGALGPETLVDLKFSPLTLLVALLGGSSWAFHLITLSLYVLAVYFLIRLITVHFRLSLISAISASVIYLLNGYNIAYLSSNGTQAYLYFPILFFTLCSFAKKPNYWRYLALIFANILFYLTTFYETTMLVMLSVYLIAFGFVLNEYPIWKTRLRVIGMQFLSAITAFFLLAFLWFPLLEGFKILKSEMLGIRTYAPAGFRGFLSFFTPKHFWESYWTIPQSIGRDFTRGAIFHFGIVTSLIVAQVFSQKKNFKNWIIIMLLILFFFFFGRIYGIPGIYQLSEIIPRINSIGQQYLWIVVAVCFPLLAAYGMDSLSQKRSKIPTLITYGIILAALFYLVFTFLPHAGKYFEIANEYITNEYISNIPIYRIFIYFNLGMLGLTVISSAIIFFHIHISPKKILLWKSLLILLAFVELFYYMNTMRYKREDIFQNPPSYISFLKQNIGNNRLVNFAGESLAPELGAAYQIPQVESLVYTFPWYQKFYERNFQTPNDRYLSVVWGFSEDAPNIHDEILDMLSVKYILTYNRTSNKYIDYFKNHNYPIVFSDSNRLIFENTDLFPRVITPSVLIKASLTPDTQGYSPRDVVFTEDDKLVKEAQALGVSQDPNDSGNIGQAEIVSYKNTKVVIHAHLQKPSILAIMDNWHPDWHAYIGGKEVYIGKINESFRGIALGQGDYTIEMKYQSKSLRIGLIFSGIVGIILFALLFFRKRFDNLLGNLVLSKLPITEPKKPNDKVSFAVVLPMYNEEKGAARCVVQVNNNLKKFKEKSAIIAVNDGSKDKTLAILLKLQKKIPSLLIANHTRNQGYGAANVTGAKLAHKKKFMYTLFMDSDLTNDPMYIKAFIAKMREGVDVIKATRYDLGGNVKEVPFKRRIVSKVGNILAKMILRLPITDYTNGFRAVKTDLLVKISFEQKGFAYLIEEIAKVSKFAKTYAEIPYILTTRKGNSESKFKYNPKVYYNYLKYLFVK